MFFNLCSLSGQRGRLIRVLSDTKKEVFLLLVILLKGATVSIFLFFSLKKVSIAIILQSTKDIIVKKPQSAGDERGKEEEKTLSPCCQAAFKAGCYAWHMTKKRRGWGSPFPLPQW